MSRVITRFGADTTGFKQGVAELQNRVSRFSTQVRGYMFKAFAAGAVLAQLRSITRELDRIDKLSRRFGVDTGFLQDLAQQADLSGASMETAARALSQLVREINRVEGPTRSVEAALDAIGLSVDNLRGMQSDQIFNLIAESIGGLSSETEALAVAQALMGRSAGELLPLLQDIYETGGLAEASRHTDEAIKSAVDFKDSMTSLGRTLRTVVSPILVVVSSLLANFLNVLLTFRRVAIEVNTAAIRSFMLLGRAIKAALTLDREGLREVAADFKNVFKEAFEEIKIEAKDAADEAIRQRKRIANAFGANFDLGDETGEQRRDRTGTLDPEVLAGLTGQQERKRALAELEQISEQERRLRDQIYLDGLSDVERLEELQKRYEAARFLEGAVVGDDEQADVQRARLRLQATELSREIMALQDSIETGAAEAAQQEREEREREQERALQDLGREETGVLQNLDRLRSALASPDAAGVGSLQRVGGGGVFNAPQADPNIKLQNEQLAELARIREAIESVQKEVE